MPPRRPGKLGRRLFKHGGYLKQLRKSENKLKKDLKDLKNKRDGSSHRMK